MSAFKINSYQQSLQYTPPVAPEYADDEIIVKFRVNAGFNPDTLSTRSVALDHLLKKHNVIKAERVHSSKHGSDSYKKSKGRAEKHSSDTFGVDRVIRLRVPKGSNIQQIVSELRMDPLVEYAEPNYLVRRLLTPNDPSYSSQWGLAKINAPAAWDINTGSYSVLVAVVDTGVDKTHPDIWGNLATNTGEISGNGIDDDGNGYIDDVYGWNFVGNNNNVMDDHMHGTHVTGILGGMTNNFLGISGLCWAASIFPVKCLDNNGVGDDARGVDAILYATDNGADVINLSWGGYYYSQAMKDACDYAYANGSLLIAAAGNDNSEAPMYPASYLNVMSVAATDQSDNKASFSNYGQYIDISAPGVAVLSAIPGGYSSEEGTSMSTPFVSGLAALIKSQNPTATHDDIKEILISTANDLGATGWDKYYGFGRIDALAALQAPLPLKSTITSPVQNSILGGTINLVGNAFGSNFTNYTVEWGQGEEPSSWSSVGISLVNGGSIAVTNGTLASLDTNFMSFNGAFTVKLTTFSNMGKKYEDRILYNKNNSVMTGWPLNCASTSDGGYAHINLYDVNNDGKQEILFPENEQVHIVDYKGNELPGWPQGDPIGGPYYFNMISSPSVGDVNGDGIPEIVYKEKNGDVYVRRPDGTILPGWPKNWPGSCGWFRNAPCVLSDLNNDGKLEIIVQGQNSMIVYDGAGNILPGWPVTVPVTNILNTGVADINNDGIKEIAIKTLVEALPSHQEVEVIYVFNSSSGAICPGWPQGDGKESWAIGDFLSMAHLNNDAYVGLATSHFGYMYQYWYNGGPYNNKVFSGSVFEGGTIPFGDVNNDGALESFYGMETGLFGMNHDLNTLPGWPKPIGNSKTSIADVNSDGKPEIISSGGLQIFNADGTSLPGWIPVNGDFNTPTFGDIDGDGKVEMVVAERYPHKIYAFKMQGAYIPGRNPWPMFGHDPQRTSYLPFASAVSPTAGYVNDGSGIDIDTQTDVSLLAANWGGFIDPNTGANIVQLYQYAIGTAPGTIDIVPWTSAGTAKSITKTGLSLTVGNTYYTSIKATNNYGLSVIKSSDGITIAPDNQTPYFTDFKSSNTNLSIKMLDDGSGINEATLVMTITNSSGTVITYSGVISPNITYYSFTGDIILKHTLPDGNYNFNLSVSDKSGNIKNNSYAFVVDTTPPVGIVNDGSGPDIDEQVSTDTLAANWLIGDLLSGIKKYDYSIGTTSGNNNITDWTDAGTASAVTRTGLSLSVGQTYYFNVRAWNNCDVSSVMSSNGVQVVLPTPTSTSTITPSITPTITSTVTQTATPTTTLTLMPTFTITPTITPTLTPTKVVPATFNAYNYPNPFNPDRVGTSIRAELPEAGKVSIRIYDSKGYLIKELAKDEQRQSGLIDFTWLGDDSTGKKVTQNVYFVSVVVTDDSGDQKYKKIVKTMVAK